MLFLLFHFIPYRNLSCPFKPGSNIISCMKPFLIFQAMLKWAERPGGEEEETGPDPCVRLIPLRGVHKLKHKVHWSGQPFPSPGNLPKPGIKPRSPALQADSLPAESQEKPSIVP